MATEGQVQGTIARCVTTVVRDHDGGRTRYTTISMIAEIQAHAAWVMELDIRPGAADEGILRPVEVGRLARYGPELGVRLDADFLKAKRSRTSAISIT